MLSCSHSNPRSENSEPWKMNKQVRQLFYNNSNNIDAPVKPVPISIKKLAEMSQDKLDTKVFCLTGNSDHDFVMLKAEKRCIKDGKIIIKFSKALEEIVGVHKSKDSQEQQLE